MNMNSFSNFFFLLISSILFLTLLPQSLVAHEDIGFVQDVCARSSNRDFCMTSLRSNPDSKQATLSQLAIIALNLASSNATDTSNYIKKLLSDKNLEPTIEQALVDCSDQYMDAVQQLDDSLAAVLADVPNDVRTWVKAALAAIESCDDGFSEHPGYESVLSSRNAVFRQLCNNVIAVSELLGHN